jgi:small conductance mechanosensitive channel
MNGTDELLNDVPVDDIERLISNNIVAALAIVVVLIVLWIFARRITHVIVGRTLAVSSRGAAEDGVQAVELEKRSRTLESLFTTLIRAFVVGTIAFLVIGFFGLWSVLTGLAIVLAALTIAGQSIVLDYMMGILIIVEGTYYEGDNISAGDPTWDISGTVEDVGLRRTTLRSPDGTVHSISNAEMRRVSNRTRIYSAAEVHVRGIRDEDLDEVLDTMNRIGEAVAADDVLGPFIMEAPQVTFLGDPDDLGWSATMRGKVIAAQRWAIGTEIRRRLNRALLEQGVELNKRGVAPRVARGPRPATGALVEPDPVGADDTDDAD